MKRFLLIANPRAGRNQGQAAGETTQQILVGAGHKVECVLTTKAGDASHIASERGGDFDVVVAIGGDGTAREVLAGLIDLSDQPPKSCLGLIPFGTANVIARELGIPLAHAAKAANILLQDHPLVLDFGFAGGEVFLANAGLGFDAMVVHELARHRREVNPKINMLSYLPIGLKLLKNYHAPKLQIDIDGEPVTGEFSFATICNLKNYGGVMAVTPKAQMDSRHFEICLRRGRGRFAILRHLLMAKLGLEDSKSTALYRRGQHFVIRSIETSSGKTAVPYSVQVDGEAFGFEPLEISIAKNQIQVLANPKRMKA